MGEKSQRNILQKNQNITTLKKKLNSIYLVFSYFKKIYCSKIIRIMFLTNDMSTIDCY